jgi:hypothetical protein
MSLRLGGPHHGFDRVIGLWVERDHFLSGNVPALVSWLSHVWMGVALTQSRAILWVRSELSDAETKLTGSRIHPLPAAAV